MVLGRGDFVEHLAGVERVGSKVVHVEQSKGDSTCGRDGGMMGEERRRGSSEEGSSVFTGWRRTSARNLAS